MGVGKKLVQDFRLRDRLRMISYFYKVHPFTSIKSSDTFLSFLEKTVVLCVNAKGETVSDFGRRRPSTYTRQYPSKFGSLKIRESDDHLLLHI